MPLGLAISVLSAAALGYEILLMRLFSIIQWHHFAYMIISLALLGIGASGAALSLARAWLVARFAAAFPASAALFGVSAVAAFALAQRVPFNPLEIAWDARQLGSLVAIYLLLAVPFVFAGGCVGMALARFAERIARLYRFDLMGAGVGALGVVAVLFALPPADCLRLIGALGFAAAALACLDAAIGRRATAGVLAAAGVALALAVPAEWLAPRPSPYKGLSQALRVPGAEVIDERSSPLGLLSVLRSPEVPLRHAPGLSLNAVAGPPEQVGVFTDGDALTAITRFDGDFAPLAYLDQQLAALPYHLLERPRALVLGAGGGAGVLRALYHGARSVDAVEINPQMAALVGRDLGEFAGGIYGRDDVRVHLAEARAFVAARRDTYDLIELSLLAGSGGDAAGVQSLKASTIYTVEALDSFLARLAPGGLLAITAGMQLPPRGALKLFATAVAALGRRGVAEPGARLALVRSWDAATLLVKNGPLSGADAAAIRAFADKRGFDLAWLPGMARDEANRYNVLAGPLLFDGAKALLGDDAEAFVDSYKFHIAPATDDRPHFFRFFKWSALPELLTLRGRGGNALIEWGYLIVVATLAQAAVASVVLIVLPLLRLERGTAARKGIGGGARVVVYFFALGLAFLFVEIAFIQRFTLFLGHPLYAAAVVLSAFLVFAGLGSGASAHLDAARLPLAPVAVAVVGIAIVALAYLVVLPPLFAALAPAPDAVKIALSAVLIAPLAFCMGMPFPLGLARLATDAPGWIPWAWAINGCASVVSAVLATLLAIHLGFTAVVALAVVLYAVAAVAFGGRPAVRRLR